MDTLIYLDDLIWLIYDNFWYLIMIIALIITKKYWQCGIFIICAKIGFPLWSWQFVVMIVLYIWYEEFFEPRKFWKRFYRKRYEKQIKKYEDQFIICVNKRVNKAIKKEEV